LENFKTLVNKNAIKPEIGGPLQAFFPESLDPSLWIMSKTSGIPSTGFSTRVHLWIQKCRSFLRGSWIML
jgi:hypothetical protein